MPTHTIDSRRSDQGVRPYHSTLRRRSALVAAIQLPVLIWMCCAYLLSSEVFNMRPLFGLTMAAGCGYVIYLIERVIIVTPMHWSIVLGRLLLTVLMSALGAAALDLVLFSGDIETRLRDRTVTVLRSEHTAETAKMELLIAQARADRDEALRRQNVEADGSDGSKTRGTGTIWAELKRQADKKQSEYELTQTSLIAVKARQESELPDRADEAVRNAGLLSRLAALHGFMQDHPVTLLAWVALFIVVMIIESSVLLAKVACGQTLLERLETMREDVVYERARRQLKALTASDSIGTNSIAPSLRSDAARLSLGSIASEARS
jgi:hypothetical protein